jgi:probable rRNA maturation factor
VVEILDETHQFPAAERLQVVLETLMGELSLAAAEMTVVILPDEEVHRLNAAHRGVDEPTDVLSYPTHEPDDVGMPPVAHLGDVLISLGVAARQAEEHGRTTAEEVAALAAHGLTHLRGHDHRSPPEWKPFLAAQDRAVELMREAPP